MVVTCCNFPTLKPLDHGLSSSEVTWRSPSRNPNTPRRRMAWAPCDCSRRSAPWGSRRPPGSTRPPRRSSMAWSRRCHRKMLGGAKCNWNDKKGENEGREVVVFFFFTLKSYISIISYHIYIIIHIYIYICMQYILMDVLITVMPWLIFAMLYHCYCMLLRHITPSIIPWSIGDGMNGGWDELVAIPAPFGIAKLVKRYTT